MHVWKGSMEDLHRILIWEVSKRPSIYDPKDPMYKDQHARQKEWAEIASAVGIPANACQAKWTTLRRGLANAIHRQSKRQSTGDTNTKKWLYHDDMSFLLPYMVCKDADHPNSYDHRSALTKFFSSENIDESDIQAACDLARKRLKLEVEKSPTTTNDADDDFYETEEIECESIDWDDENIADVSVQSTSKPETDDLEMFFLAMAKVVKKLPKLDQVKARSKVYEVITAAEMEFLQRRSPSPDSGKNSDKD